MVNIETEFKYLVNKLPSELPTPYEITQIYFDGNKKINELNSIFPTLDISTIHTFRARVIKYKDRVKYVITLKTKGAISRDEYELEVEEHVISDLIENNIISIIIKNRYIVMIDGYNFEFDEYLNLKTQILTCEVEIENYNIEAQKKKIENIFSTKLKLSINDVTFDNRYKNSNMIKYFG